jgi:hypothetical protein
MLYAYGDTVGWSVTDPLYSSNGDTVLRLIASPVNWRVDANDPCPDGWRLPFITEARALANTPNHSAERNGIIGCQVESGNSTLFLPSAPSRYSSLDLDHRFDEKGVNYANFWVLGGGSALRFCYNTVETYYFYTDLRVFPSYYFINLGEMFISIRCVQGSWDDM